MPDTTCTWSLHLSTEADMYSMYVAYVHHRHEYVCACGWSGMTGCVRAIVIAFYQVDMNCVRALFLYTANFLSAEEWRELSVHPSVSVQVGGVWQHPRLHAPCDPTSVAAVLHSLPLQNPWQHVSTRTRDAYMCVQLYFHSFQ